MIYLYDDAICEDLSKSFNPINTNNPVVKVIGPDKVIELAASLQNDQITFPIVAITREPGTPIDTSRTNFSWMHKGIACVFDNETNEYYNEKVIPIKLNYKITVLTTNTIDMDEIIRELLFKYTNMYFLTITLPYEGRRKIRYGVTISKDEEIERQSGTVENLETGQLHQTIIPIKCEGCVLVSYTPVKLRNSKYTAEIEQ